MQFNIYPGSTYSHFPCFVLINTELYKTMHENNENLKWDQRLDEWAMQFFHILCNMR